MKIIGKTAEGVLLSATEDEVAELVGYYSAYSAQRVGAKLVPGAEIKVSEMYKQLHDLARARTGLDAARKTLQTTAEMLLLIDPVIPSLNVEEPTREDH